MDFFQVVAKEIKGGALEVYPDYVVGRSKDLMIRGKSFYAIWNEDTGLWSTDEYDVQRLIDRELKEYADKHDNIKTVKYTRSFSSNSWNQFKKYLTQLSDNSKQLDENLTFANTEVKKEDYVSRRLPYKLAPGDYSAWDEIVGTLYKPEEREKIEWAIGSIVAGDSPEIEKFLVLYGPPGYGKGTIIKIVLKLFDGYTTTFDAKELTKANNGFATEKFKGNPLVAVQHDGDLSRIEDNTKLNSIVSHEMMTINEKYKPGYDARINAFLIMGTNSPVKISDAKSGMIRRLIDVHPSGNLFSPTHYHELMARVNFELGAIAHHCLEVYRKLGKNHYSNYRPLEMMLQTDFFYNFIEAHYDIFKEQNGVSLKQAYTLYKEYCEDAGIEKPLSQIKVREQLRNYFEEFHTRIKIDGRDIRSYYAGFTAQPFKAPIKDDGKHFSLVLDETTSIFDLEGVDYPAQYAKDDGTPQKRWAEVKTTLAEIDTSELHYVKVPENHIVIDFDLKGDDGEKSLERNLTAASEWPPTYAELSKSGKGVHLHYLYDGDPTQLATSYSDGIEVKVYTGNGSLRRRLSRCNNVPISVISSGLPLKEKKVLNTETIQSEKGLRNLIARNLRKEIHPGTKPSIDFIHHILEEAYKSGMEYDVTDLRASIVSFANNSTNQPLQSLKIVKTMRFKSDEGQRLQKDIKVAPVTEITDDRLAIFDLEVYPNLFVVCWKFEDAPEETMVKMVNPSPQDMEDLFKLKLVGFNNRRYDNHILYARYLGYNNEQLYKLSKKIIDGVKNALFGEAYNLSYTDIYDYASVKQGLKKWQIALGLLHKEMGISWDEPVPEELIPEVVDYCANDVLSTEAVHKSRKGDYVARQILAELSGLSMNHTTQNHAAAIIFEGDKNPQRHFIYTDLSKDFPGYKYDFGKSTYREEVTGEGGYVYAEPGMYEDVVLLDVASMHPTSIIQLNLFGDDYTQNFKEIVDARLAIKHASEAHKKGQNDWVDFYMSDARSMLNGKLAPYLQDISGAKALSDALKIVINIVYGLTSAKFDNPFRDPRNKDNIVAKRGALFMIDLKHMVQEAGFQVAHIKTDSIKIPGAPQWLIDQITEFGNKYGYSFEHEATYSKFCLVNDAVYIARQDTHEPVMPEGAEFNPNYAYLYRPVKKWTAVGAQFQHPYVFKTLFTGEDVGFSDMCEARHVQKGSIHLDFTGMDNPEYPYEGLHFVGKTGLFVPVVEGYGGGILYRVNDGKHYAVAGTKGYKWVEFDVAKTLPDEAINIAYFERLGDSAKATIEKFGSFEAFVS